MGGRTENGGLCGGQAGGEVPINWRPTGCRENTENNAVRRSLCKDGLGQLGGLNDRHLWARRPASQGAAGLAGHHPRPTTRDLPAGCSHSLRGGVAGRRGGSALEGRRRRRIAGGGGGGIGALGRRVSASLGRRVGTLGGWGLVVRSLVHGGCVSACAAGRLGAALVYRGACRPSSRADLQLTPRFPPPRPHRNTHIHANPPTHPHAYQSIHPPSLQPPGPSPHPHAGKLTCRRAGGIHGLHRRRVLAGGHAVLQSDHKGNSPEAHTGPAHGPHGYRERMEGWERSEARE